VTTKAKTKKRVTACIIDFEPVGRRGKCQKNESLLACARRLGVGISSICGGKGTCHACKVKVLSGTFSKPTPSEHEEFISQELKEGWRLACQTYPTSDAKLIVPAESMTTPQRLQVEGLEITILPESSVQSYHLKLVAPSLSALQADADRLLQALNQRHKLHCRRVDIDALRTLSDQLRSWDWECQAVVRNSEVANCIILENTVIENMGQRIEDSLIGRNVALSGSNRLPRSYRLVLGDFSQIYVP